MLVRQQTFDDAYCWVCAKEYNQHNLRKACIYEHDKLKSCGIILCDENDNVLILRENQPQKQNKLWSFPKGRQDHVNEVYQRCAEREMFEETNIRVQLRDDHKKFTHGKHVYFVVQITESDKQKLDIFLDNENDAYEWINFASLKTKQNCNLGIREFTKCRGIPKYLLQKYILNNEILQ